jgi:hypothetical protein
MRKAEFGVRSEKSARCRPLTAEAPNATFGFIPYSELRIPH